MTDISPDRILVVLEAALTWAREATQPQGGLPLAYSFLEDWSGFGRLQFGRPELFAVTIDKDDFYSDELDRVTAPCFLHGGSVTRRHFPSSRRFDSESSRRRYASSFLAGVLLLSRAIIWALVARNP